MLTSTWGWTLWNSAELPSCTTIHGVTPGSWSTIWIPTIVSHQATIRETKLRGRGCQKCLSREKSKITHQTYFSGVRECEWGV